MRNLTIAESAWPLARPFVIARGARSEALVIQVTITQDGQQGRGECVPYGRYGESLASVHAQIEGCREAIENGMSREELHKAMPAGAARNALDCALWDLDARLKNSSVAALSGLGRADTMITAQTLSIDSPENMAEEASLYSDYPILKVKLDGEHILERVQAVHKAAPEAKFIVDANEAWQIDQLNQIANSLEIAKVVLIEQPLPAGGDKSLRQYTGNVPLCADESFHCQTDLAGLIDRYQAINIKLDKTGGLTEAIDCLSAAKAHDLQVMVGCMVGTSLAMAPATLLAQHADFVDLDGPALMAKDVEYGFDYSHGAMSNLNPALWGN